MDEKTIKTEKIAKLNDKLRSIINYPVMSKTKDKFVITQGIGDCFNLEEMQPLFHDIRTFNNFNDDNNIYGERDFGSLTAKGRKIFWKIDYYDNNLKYHSPDNTNPEVTTRVLTVMLSSEY